MLNILHSIVTWGCPTDTGCSAELIWPLVLIVFATLVYSWLVK